MKSLLNRKLSDGMLFVCAIGFTFAWGLFAHLYGLTNSIFSHDSLNALVSGPVEESWKIQLGRFMVPLYRSIFRVNISLPWLIGATGLLFVGLALYLVAKILRIRTVLPLFLAAGVLSTNITSIALIATYVYEFDLDMASFLLAVLAVYFWDRKRFGFLFGAIPLALSLGFYQAYFASAVALIMTVCLCRLLNGFEFRKVLVRGFKGILMLLLGGAVYYGLVVLSCRITGNELADTYNGLFRLVKETDHSFPNLVIEAYGRYFSQLAGQVPGYPLAVEIVIQGLIFVVTMAAFIHTAVRNRLKVPSVLLAVLLLLLLPLAMNSIYVLDKGMAHQLMTYSFCLTHIFALAVIASWERGGTPSFVYRGAQALLAVAVAAMLWGNVQGANAVYMKKDIEYKAELSIMTRALDRIESYPGYERGKTVVAVMGRYLHPTVSGFRDYASYTGAGYTSPISGYNPSWNWDLYAAYFKWVMNVNVNTCDPDTWQRIRRTSELRDMAVFPQEGCIRMIGDVLVIRMSEDY